MDYAIAQAMAKDERFTAAQIAKTIAESTPNVNSRDAGKLKDYAVRTANLAWCSPEVERHRQLLDRDRDLDQGLGMSR